MIDKPIVSFREIYILIYINIWDFFSSLSSSGDCGNLFNYWLTGYEIIEIVFYISKISPSYNALSHPFHVLRGILICSFILFNFIAQIWGLVWIGLANAESNHQSWTPLESCVCWIIMCTSFVFMFKIVRKMFTVVLFWALPD